MKTCRASIILAVLLVIWAVSVAVFGGVFVEWHGWRLSSREPLRPFAVSVLVVGLARWRYGREAVRRDLGSDREWRRFRSLVSGDRAGSVCCGSRRGVPLGEQDRGRRGFGTGKSASRNCGSTETSSFLSRSPRRFRGQRLTGPSHRSVTSRRRQAAQSLPIYAPGLPMLMAVLSLIHPDGVFWVVPLAGAALVVLSFLLGRALGGSAAGLLTAALVATSPAFLFQLMAPMSDVVVAAFWIAALVLALPNRLGRWFLAGLASSLAILTRPNTAPIAAVFVLVALWKDASEASRAVTGRQRVLHTLAYAAGILPGVLGVAAIHTALYRIAVSVWVQICRRALRTRKPGSESRALSTLVRDVGDTVRLPGGRRARPLAPPRTQPPARPVHRALRRCDLALLPVLPTIRGVVVSALPVDRVSVSARTGSRVLLHAAEGGRHSVAVADRRCRAHTRLVVADRLRPRAGNVRLLEARKPLRRYRASGPDHPRAERSSVQHAAERQPPLLLRTIDLAMELPRSGMARPLDRHAESTGAQAVFRLGGGRGRSVS